MLQEEIFYKVNGYSISVSPYKKIYLLLKNNKQDKIKKHIKKLYGIYKKMAQRKIRLLDYLKDYVLLFKLADKIFYFKKIFKQKIKKKKLSLIEINFTHLYVSIENFLDYDSEFFCKKIYYYEKITEELKNIVKNSFYDIFEIIFFPTASNSVINEKISNRIFNEYIITQCLTIFLEYLYCKLCAIISKPEIKRNIFIINTTDYLQEIFGYVYRTQRMFISFSCTKEVTENILENYIIKIFNTLHIFFKNRIDEIPKKEFDIEHFLCFYKYIKKFEEHFSSIYHPEFCFDGFLTKVFNEKIEIDLQTIKRKR
jgi:hypothetical protein